MISNSNSAPVGGVDPIKGPIEQVGHVALLDELIDAHPEDLAVLISITGFALAAIWGLIGGGVSLFYRPGDGSHASLGERESQVGEIEHQIEEEEKA